MSFPKSKRTLFQNNPLAMVSCQLDFPPILAIASSDPAEFQDKIRAGYPLYKRESEPEVPAEVAEMLASFSFQRPGNAVHVFSSEDSSRSISLNKEYLTFVERDYHRWESFQEELHQAFDALEEIYHPSFYSRASLRYLDVLDRSRLELGDVPWVELLHSWVLGLGGKAELEQDIKRSFNEFELSLAEEQASVTLRHGTITLEGDRHGYAIDADFFSVGRLTSTEIRSLLGRLNKRAGDLFRWCITDKLREALSPVPISND